MSELPQKKISDWEIDADDDTRLGAGRGMPSAAEGPTGRPKLKLVTVGDDSVSQSKTGAPELRSRRISPSERRTGSEADAPSLRIGSTSEAPPTESARHSDDSQITHAHVAKAIYQQLSEEKRVLELAQAQIADWAQTLEDRVAERTAEIRRRNSQLTMLNTLAKAINQSLDPDQMSSSVLQLVCELFGAEMGVVWICPPGNSVSVKVHRGLPDVWDRRLARGWPTQELLGQHMRSRHSCVVADTGKDISPEARMARHLGMRSAAFVPIRARNEVIGLMVIGSEDIDVLDGEDTTVLDVFSDQFGVGITNALLYEEARRSAAHDPVTGLLNHRTLQQRLLEAMSSADESRGTLAVVLMDLDNFKFFNDTYGHLSGDDVLRMVGMAIEQTCSASDVCGRYGGDEFMLLLPGADHQTAARAAQKVRKLLSDTGYRPSGQNQHVPLAMSYGVAVYPSDGLSRHELIVQADANLFRSKTGGGDVVSAPSPYITHARTIAGYELLDSLVATVDNKDRYTRRHSEDVAEYAAMLGRAMGLDEPMIDTLAVAGLLHDVGKIGVPDSILRKPGKLTSDELVAVQSHPTFGALIVGAIPSLRHILPAVRHHHERWDGRGYPDGLAAEDIPVIARIMAVADAVSAMTTDRPYRNGMEWDEVLDAIEKGLGTQFDPVIGRIFVEHMRARKFYPGTTFADLSEAA